MPESQLHEARHCRSARFGQPGRLGGLCGTPLSRADSLRRMLPASYQASPSYPSRATDDCICALKQLRRRVAE